jgi:hypothetical protein
MGLAGGGDGVTRNATLDGFLDAAGWTASGPGWDWWPEALA